MALRPHPVRVFEEFPGDPNLKDFDRSDRKFVAVACASRAKPAPVWNAVDSDWWVFERVFGRHGVTIDHVCPDMIAVWRRNHTQR